MEYNTQREKLKITDYGRHVAKMIDYARTLENRDDRNAMANTIIDVMAHVAPKIKERADYKHILWDHMMMLANYDLDVDCPYEIKREDSETLNPKPIGYREGEIRYRHYGRALEDMIKAVAEMPDGDERRQITEQIAHTMKRQYLQWNRDTVEDDVIKDQLRELSGGKLSLPEDFEFCDSQTYLDAMAASATKKDGGKSKKKKKKNKDGKL